MLRHGFFSIGCLLWEGGTGRKSTLLPTTRQFDCNQIMPRVYNNRGNIKIGLGSHDAALDDYDEAIRLNPNFMNAYINRGIVQLDLNNTDKVRVDLQRALELAEQQGNDNLKVYIEKWLQELNN